MKKKFTQYPLFLLTVPLFLLLHIEQQYHQLINYQLVYKDIAWLLAFPVVFLLLSCLLFRDKEKAYLFCFVLLIISYFFCDLKDWLEKQLPGSLFSSYGFVLPFIAVLILCIFFYLRKKNLFVKKSLAFINVLFLLFVITAIVQIIIVGTGSRNKIVSQNIPATYIPCNTCTKSDIYYFIFDAYTSSTVLQSQFNYSNNIDSFLTSKQFFIARHSVSNYNLTAFSMASCFDLQYLQGIPTTEKVTMGKYMPLLNTVYNNQLMTVLQKEGYHIVNHSIFNMENHPNMPPVFNTWNIDLLYNRHNILKKIDTDIGWLIRSKLHLPQKPNNQEAYINSRDDHFFKTLAAVKATIQATDTAPRFTYTHFLLPHGPYSIDSSGKRTTQFLYYRNLEEKKKGYLQHVAFCNTIMRELVEDIFKYSKRPFIIIIQGDHGFRYEDYTYKQLEFANLNALYFYNQDYHLLSDSMSNVNTFRIVLNTFFKQKLPLLKDTSWFLKYK